MPSLGLRILKTLVTSEEPLTIDGLSKELGEDTVEVVLAMARLAESDLITPRKKTCVLYWYPTRDGKNTYLAGSADFGCGGSKPE